MTRDTDQVEQEVSAQHVTSTTDSAFDSGGRFDIGEVSVIGIDAGSRGLSERLRTVERNEYCEIYIIM